VDILKAESKMAHLLNHPLHLGKDLGPKDCRIADTGVDRRIDLIRCIVHRPQTPPDELLLEEGHLGLLHLLLPHHLPSLHQVLEVEVREPLLVTVLALSMGVDGVVAWV